jgi:uncharacterized membrane protein YkvA (DUF1232 family)
MVRGKISEKEARKHLEKKAKGVTKKDVEDILKRKKEIDEKLKKVPGTLGKMINQIKLLFGMIADYWNGTYQNVPWFSIAMAVAAIVYFLSPIDLIPDFIPVIGYVDDALVIAVCILVIEKDLRAYCAFKGYEAAQYF